MGRLDTTPEAAAGTGRPALLRWIGRALLWLPAALLGATLAGALALGLWAGSEGSLAQALRWGLAWQARHAPAVGTVVVDDVQGSVLGGGALQSLTWANDSVRVRADDLRVPLGGQFWLGLLRGQVRLAHWHAARVQVEPIATSSAPTEPFVLQALELPLPIDLDLSVDALVVREQTLRAIDLQYRYGRADPGLGTTDAHSLTLGSLQWAEGRYQAQLTLGAQAPMPLQLQARGELRAQVPEGGDLSLRARLNAQGLLAGDAAAIDLAAQIEPATSTDATPTLAGSARVKPWAAQPLEEADLRLHRLDLGLLWPQAPRTALTGTLRARPDGPRWQAQARLDNELPGPLDQRRMPVQSIALELQQSDGLWTLPSLELQLGDGRLQAQGQHRPASAGAPTGWLAMLGESQGRLTAQGIDPSRIWSTLAPAALDADLQAQARAQAGSAPAIDLRARVAPAGRQPPRSAAQALRLRELALQGRWQPEAGDPARGVLTLQRAHLDVLDGGLDFQGRVDTARPQASGQLNLDLPGLQARLDGTLAQADGAGDVTLQLADGARLLNWLRGLRAVPLVGESIERTLQPWADVALDARAHARLNWQGGLGALPVPVWGNRAGVAPPRIDLQLQVERLRLQRGGEAPMDVALNNSRLGLKGPAQALALALHLDGQASQRPFTLDTDGQLNLATAPLNARDGELRLERLALGVRRAPSATRWAVDSGAPLRLRWQARTGGTDAELDAGQLRVRPTGTGAEATPLNLAWDSLSWRGGALLTRGRLQGLPLAWLDALGRADTDGGDDTVGPLANAGLGGDLIFDGRWDLSLPAQAGEPPRLALALERRSGDLAVQTDGAAFEDRASRTNRVPAGVKTAQLFVNTDGPRVTARLRWDSERFGEASAEASSPLSPPDAQHPSWHWPAHAPLTGRLSASLPQVGVWSVLAPPGWRVRGALSAQATLSGTQSDPQFSGSLQANELALRSIVEGVSFRGGELRATLAGDRLVIERFRLEGRGGAQRGGTLEASGSAEWRRVQDNGVTRREPVIELQATATQLHASTRPDRHLKVSGALQARLEGAAFQLRGNLRADEALIVLPDETAPTLGDDVVVRGTEYPIQRSSGVRVVPDVRVTLDLGESFELRGQGLQTRLAGQLEVRSAPSDPAPRVVGEVRTVRGTYRAYGQQLAIETGVLRFNGPYDNPTLDIVAVRPNATTQRVGVQITGSAQSPRVRLFSDPDLPDSEKLAWLVLGRPASGAGAEAAVLQQAAIALLAGRDGGPLAGGLAGAFGLDALSFVGESTNADGTTRAGAVTLGKRLADNLYLSYERSLAGTLNTVSIFYDVTRRFTIRARAGSENAVDLIFTLSYD